ncbi:DUF2142 domain-containing protein [Frankia sp. CgS1]|uniref:DUF2142 domain-containing protein n=1 Tax=Frankia sp. CgS1 TaxID=1745381 RepID=UPI0020C821E7|nr:DUF2142 domain-containing protein [Frankia sp. CgIS1]
MAGGPECRSATDRPGSAAHHRSGRSSWPGWRGRPGWPGRRGRPGWPGRRGRPGWPGRRGRLRGTADRSPGASRLPPRLLVAGFLLLVAAWVATNPPGFGPDEPAHFVKAVGAGTGQWTGTPGRLAHPSFGNGPGRAERIDWINRNSRVFALPAGLNPGAAGLPCDLFRDWVSVACLDRPRPRPPATRALSYVGTYEPYLYAVEGAVMIHTHTADGALYAGRATSAAIVVTLLTIIIFASWDSRAGLLSVGGVLLAVSPMALFLGSVLGTNGMEIAGATALFTLALRLGRPGAPPRWIWPALGLVAALVALSRPSGPLWVLLTPMIAAGLAAPRARARAVDAVPAVEQPRPVERPRSTEGTQPTEGPRRHRLVGWLSVPWIALAVAGVVATAVWERRVQPHPGIRRELAEQGLRQLSSDAPAWARQWVGVFGWASLRMPSFAYWTWGACLLVLLGAAFVVGTWRQRIRLGAVLIGVVAVAVVLDVLVLRQTRFPVYGRYLLPIAVLVPLAAGEILTRRAARIPATLRRAGPAVAVMAVVAVHAVGLWTDWQRSAVGSYGPAWFLGSSQWNPPGGWVPWMALAGAGACCLLAAAAAGLWRPGRGVRPHRPAAGTRQIRARPVRVTRCPGPSAAPAGPHRRPAAPPATGPATGT